tara:strand:- start:36 stop:1190 length:1155 start_codon:yes stop_codon:yes gene_type:complete
MVFGNSLSAGTPTDGTVSLAKLSATGTKDATTFLRGDNTFAAAGVTGISSSADATAITIDSNEQVGIGTGSPLEKLHIETSSGDADVLLHAAEDNSGSDARLFLKTTNTSATPSLFFGDSANDGMGYVKYANDGNSMQFGTNAATRIVVNNIGETVINSAKGSGLSSTLELQYGGTKAGIVGSEGTTNLVVGSGDIGLKMDDANNIYRPYNVNTGSGVDNTGDLGSGSHRFKVIYAGTGSINTSDERHKNNITDTDLGLDFVNKLKPKKYKLNDGQSGRTHYGLISQDVETLLGEISKSTTDFAGFVKTDISEDNRKDIENIDLVLNDETKNLTKEQIEELNTAKTKVQNKNDDIYALRYEEFISPIIKAIQELTTRIKALEDK